MGRISDKTGQRYGMLVVLSLTDERSGRHVVWRCRCDCDTLLNVSTANLRAEGGVRACGCQRETLGGLHALYPSEHDVWSKMLSRCCNKKDKDYSRYGGRGIRVCKRWRIFANFVEDMCPRPADGLQLDRRNNDSSYSPKNCRWVTPRVNSNNRRSNRHLTYLGETKTLAQWSRKFNVPADTLSKRLRVRGWSVKKALTTPAPKGK